MYVFKARTVVELKDTLYYCRQNLSGLSNGIKKRPFDALLAISRLKNDLLESGFAGRRLDSRIAAEAFHLIRDDSPLYRVKALDKEWYNYVKDKLGLRRKLNLMYLIHKKQVLLMYLREKKNG